MKSNDNFVDATLQSEGDSSELVDIHDVSLESVQSNETLDNLPSPQNEPVADKLPSIAQMNSDLKRSEVSFALKMTAKHLLSQEALNEIFEFYELNHSKKLDLLTCQLKKNSEGIDDINKVIDTIRLADNVSGLKDELSTHHRRTNCMKVYFKFIEPLPVPIGHKGEEPSSVMYRMPVKKKLARMLDDNFLRDHIIQQPCFSNPDKRYKVFKSFEDGNLIKLMDLYGPYILIQMYLDGFGLNNAIGSITLVVVF